MNSNATDHKEAIVIYYRDGSVQVNLDNILTLDHKLYPNMRVLKQEGSHFDPIEIIGIWDDNEYVYLTIRDIKSGKVGVISQILDWDNKYFLWSIISLGFFNKMLEDRIMARLIVGNTV